MALVYNSKQGRRMKQEDHELNATQGNTGRPHLNEEKVEQCAVNNDTNQVLTQHM